MQEFGPPSPGGGQGAGLVLLYAEPFAALPAAWALRRPRSVVGREEPADIRIAVNAVSRVHAEIVWEQYGPVLRDLGSTNGTFIDGRRVLEARLEPDQELRFGDAIVKFVDHDAEHFSRYRIDGEVIQGRREAGEVHQLAGGYQMDRIAADIERIARSELTVLLLGESGTGKEVVARELHRVSRRRGRFCAVNCAAIPPNLIESELFGFKRGAFTGADRDKPGLIRTAHGGTLLLDEIGDMPLEAQAKLLRALQSKEVYPLGATEPERVNVRVVGATHRDLSRLQVEGKFRPDLFARLNEYQVRLPPLRERKEDIYLLLRTFLLRHGRPELAPSFPFLTALLHYDWPYNVRELESCVKRCVALTDGRVLDADLLPDAIREEMAAYGQPLAPAGPNDTEPERAGRGAAPTEDELRALLKSHGGNVAAVGRDLGKARMQIHRWIQRYGIDLDDYRS